MALTYRKRTFLTVAVVVLLVAGASAVWLRQGANEVTIDDALTDFRANAPATTKSSVAAASETSDAVPSAGPPAGATGVTPAAAPTAATPTGANASPQQPPPASPPRHMPDEGVYTFDTEGFEETNALGGARHDYPKQTAWIVRRAECGWTERWQPLRERYDEALLCHEPTGVGIRRFTTHHEFFQRALTSVYDCPAGNLVRPWDLTPGQRWVWKCEGKDGAVTSNSLFVGRQAVTVEGQAIDADYAKYESQTTGANRGTINQERWFHPVTGMLLQMKVDIRTNSDSPFGAVDYREQYRITLTSLTPRR